VRIGVDAPRDVAVHREEILDRPRKDTPSIGEKADEQADEQSDQK
jgi:sRNA-binding carbon storage regulator CsrA